MKLLFRDYNLHQCHFFKGIIESEGIPCFIKNEHICFSLMGYLGPLPDFWPELWVLNEKHYEQAREIFDNYQVTKISKP